MRISGLEFRRVLFQSNDVRALFTAYAAGLNHYAEKHPGEVRMRGLFPVTGEDVVAGFVLRSPFFFGLDSVLGKLAAGEPLGREGGPAIDVTGKVVPRVGRKSTRLNSSH